MLPHTKQPLKVLIKVGYLTLMSISFGFFCTLIFLLFWIFQGNQLWNPILVSPNKSHHFSLSFWCLLWVLTDMMDLRSTWHWLILRLKYCTRKSVRRLIIMRNSLGFSLQGARHNSVQHSITITISLAIKLTRYAQLYTASPTNTTYEVY